MGENFPVHPNCIGRSAGWLLIRTVEPLGRMPSKVSKLELGQQTPTRADLVAWTEAAGEPEAAEALADELAALESFYQEFRRRLRSGMRFRQQEAYGTEAKARFWIIDDDAVVIETLTAELKLTRPDEIETYARVFDQMATLASYGAATRTILTRVLLTRSGESRETEGDGLEIPRYCWSLDRAAHSVRRGTGTDAGL